MRTFRETDPRLGQFEEVSGAQIGPDRHLFTLYAHRAADGVWLALREDVAGVRPWWPDGRRNPVKAGLEEAADVADDFKRFAVGCLRGAGVNDYDYRDVNFSKATEAFLGIGKARQKDRGRSR